METAAHCSATRYSVTVPADLWWDEEDAAHIRSRSARYPGAENIEPAWTLGSSRRPAPGDA